MPFEIQNYLDKNESFLIVTLSPNNVSIWCKNNQFITDLEKLNQANIAEEEKLIIIKNGFLNLLIWEKKYIESMHSSFPLTRFSLSKQINM